MKIKTEELINQLEHATISEIQLIYEKKINRFLENNMGFYDILEWNDTCALIKFLNETGQYNTLSNQEQDRYKIQTASMLIDKYRNQAVSKKNLNSKKTGIFKTEYKGSCLSGRTHPKNGMGLASFGRNIRNYLIKERYYDFDIINSTPCITSVIGDKLGVEQKYIPEFIKNRHELYSSVNKQILTVAPNYDTSKTKKLVIGIFYGGSYKNQLLIDYPELKGKGIEIKELDRIKHEVEEIVSKLKNNYPTLYDKYCKEKRTKNKAENKPPHSNLDGSFMSKIVEGYETSLLDAVVRYLCENTNLTTLPQVELYSGKVDISRVITYEYDGFKLYKKSCENSLDTDDIPGDIVNFLNKLSQKLTGTDKINWCEKPIETEIDVPPPFPVYSNVPDNDSLYSDAGDICNDSTLMDQVEPQPKTGMVIGEGIKGITEEQAYFFNKKIWEVNNCKVLLNEGDALFINIKNIGTVEQKLVRNTKQGLKNCYEPYTHYIDEQGKNHSFINRWIGVGSQIKTYEGGMGSYPFCIRDMPAVWSQELLQELSGCQPDVFNIFIPYRASLLPPTDDVADNPHELKYALELFQKLILILSGASCDFEDRHKNRDYNYIWKWICYVIQFPTIKHTALQITGKQGDGKGTFKEILEILVGKDKVYTSTKPDRDVFGNFNSGCADAIFLIFEEASKLCMAQNGGTGQLKSLITDKTHIINEKHKPAIEVPSNLHILAFSNSNNSLTDIPTDDRRMCAFRTNSETLFDTPREKEQFYREIRTKLIEHDRAVRYVYECIVDTPLDKVEDRPRPHQNAELLRLKEACESYEYKFINKIRELIIDGALDYRPNIRTKEDNLGDKILTTDDNYFSNEELILIERINLYPSTEAGNVTIYNTTQGRLHEGFKLFLETIEGHSKYDTKLSDFKRIMKSVNFTDGPFRDKINIQYLDRGEEDRVRGTKVDVKYNVRITITKE